ncbi:unnamed protein product, partial [Ectocarpus sp. 12 AP-2014]
MDDGSWMQSTNLWCDHWVDPRCYDGQPGRVRVPTFNVGRVAWGVLSVGSWLIGLLQLPLLLFPDVRYHDCAGILRRSVLLTS